MRLYNNISTKLDTNLQVFHVKKLFIKYNLRLITFSVFIIFLISIIIGNYYYASIQFIIFIFCCYELLLLKNLKLDYGKNYNMFIRIGIILIFSMAYFLILSSWPEYPIVIIWFIPIPLIIYVFYNLLYTFITVLALVIAILSIFLFTEYYVLSDLFNQVKLSKSLKYVFNFINVFLVSIMVFYGLYTIYYINKKSNKTTEKIKKTDFLVNKNLDFELKIENLYNEINYLFLNKEIYKDKELDIQMLANMLNTNITYISISLNQKANKNFKTFSNEFKIKHVINDLNNGVHKKFTLKHIYNNAGFSSQSSFNRVFKSHYNLTPSEYIEKLT
jgi:AraC-like DNA-binding protein